MAHSKSSKSAVKRARQNIKNRTRNKSRNSELHSLERKVKEEKDMEKRKKLYSLYSSRFDKAVKAGIVKKNKASRKKSRLAIFLKKSN